MNKLLILIVFSSFFCLAQNTTNDDSFKKEISCNLLPSVKTGSALSFYLKEISEFQYESKKNKTQNEFVLFQNSDSIENILNKEYPKIFKRVNDGYDLNSYDGTKIRIENNITESKSYSRYSFKGKYEEYIFIMVEYYEGSEVIITNTKTNKSISTVGKPHFINNELIYSSAFDYGTLDIHIFDLKKKESVLLSFENWLIEDYYNFSIYIRFKVKCLNSEEKRYIEVLKY